MTAERDARTGAQADIEPAARANEPVAPTPDERPLPPRYWWAKRIGLASVALLLVVAAAWVLWDRTMRLRLERKIAELRALGQPVLFEDFVDPDVKDEDNAALDYERAVAAMVFSTGWPDFGELYQHPELFRSHPEACERVIAPNAKAIRLAQSAQSKTELDWGVRATSPPANATIPLSAAQRQLGRLLCAAVQYQHACKNDEQALAVFLSAQDLAERVGRTQGSLIAALVGNAIEQIALNTLEDITPQLQVRGASFTVQHDARPARRETVIALIAKLQADDAWVDNWRQAFYAERAAFLTTPGQFKSALTLAGGGTGFPRASVSVSEHLLRPALRADAVFAAEYYHEVLVAISGRRFPDRRTSRFRYPPFTTAYERTVHLLSRMGFVAGDKVMELRFRALAKRRMAATALALRLYELDHGRRPDSLDALVPGYLQAVPLDPFAEGGRPFAYRPNLQPALLYSVWLNGIDNDGRLAGTYDRSTADPLWYLDGDRPRPPPRIPASQAVDNQAEEERDQRQADEDERAGDNGHDRERQLDQPDPGGAT